MMRLFDELDIETQSDCNRRCPTCLRNSHPARAALTGYFAKRRLPDEVVYDILDQAARLGFRGAVCLSFYNEPLLDDRLPEFARYAKRLGRFGEVFACTNADYLTVDRAAQLDGALDNLRVALYSGDVGARTARYRAWFTSTHLTFTGGAGPAPHIPRHYHAKAPGLARLHQNEPCEMETQRRCIIAHDGALRLCCEDIAGAWGLGNIRERPLADLWYGEPHAYLLAELQRSGGRTGDCLTCPQANTPYWSAGRQELRTGDY